MRRCAWIGVVWVSVGCATDSRSIDDPSAVASTGGHNGGTASDSGVPPSDSTTIPGTTGNDPTTTGDGGEPGSDSNDASASSTSVEGSTGDRDGDTGDELPPNDSVSACCSPSGSGGCADAPIESCVCAQDDYCCSGAWDIACAMQVEDFNCGSCGMTDEIAACEAFCTTVVTCDPNFGFPDVQTCVHTECLQLLELAEVESDACHESMSRYYACIGLLTCPGFDDYVGMNPPNGFPCMSFQNTMFDSCSFIP